MADRVAEIRGAMTDEVAKIPLTKGYVAIVDAELASELAAYRWHVRTKTRTDGSVRAYAWRMVCDGARRFGVAMHRQIIAASQDQEVDHINGDGMDNRRANLRIATPGQNRANMRKYRGSSRYKGVTNEEGRWRAAIKLNNRKKHLGCFGNEEDAAHAYDRAAREIFGEFARCNFPLPLPIQEPER